MTDLEPTDSKPTDLDAIEARLARATPGPWHVDDSGRGVEAMTEIGAVEVVAWTERADAILIAHAPEDLRALLARVREFEADRDKMQHWTERAAADENANAADLARVTTERDEARAALAAAEARGREIGNRERDADVDRQRAVWVEQVADAEARGDKRSFDAAIKHTMALEAQIVSLLRWQSVASDAHVDHICALIRSLAVSDETPRTLRDLSAMGVEEEVRRIVAAERINREKSEASAREWRKKAEDAEAPAPVAEPKKEAAPVPVTGRILPEPVGVRVGQDFGPLPHRDEASAVEVAPGYTVTNMPSGQRRIERQSDNAVVYVPNDVFVLKGAARAFDFGRLQAVTRLPQEGAG